jgi:hypothetical protein
MESVESVEALCGWTVEDMESVEIVEGVEVLFG